MVGRTPRPCRDTSGDSSDDAIDAHGVRRRFGAGRRCRRGGAAAEATGATPPASSTTPKYPADFPHFDYVIRTRRRAASCACRTSAPSIAQLRPAGGSPRRPRPRLRDADGLLDRRGLDRIRAARRGVEVSGRLSPPSPTGFANGAKWHDGEPITAEDVVWSFDKLKELNPQQAFYYQHVVKAEMTGEREVTFTFDQKGNRELPHIVGQLLILPKHWWEGTDAEGKKRDIAHEHARGAARLRSLRVKRSIRPDRRLRARSGLLGRRICRSRSARTISTTSATSTSATRRSSSRPSRPTRSTGGGERGPRWATGYDFPAVKDSASSSSKSRSLSHRRRDGRLRPQPAPRSVPGPARAPGAELCLRLRGAEPHAVLSASTSGSTAISTASRLPPRACRRARSWRSSKSVRDKVPPEVFTEDYANPVGGTPTKAARQPAQGARAA